MAVLPSLYTKFKVRLLCSDDRALLEVSQSCESKDTSIISLLLPVTEPQAISRTEGRDLVLLADDGLACSGEKYITLGNGI